MNDKRCPSESDLLSFADADLSPEQLKRVEMHLELCSGCARRVIGLNELIADVAAPLSDVRFDVAAHVDGVMRRLDSPALEASGRRWPIWAGGVSLAAALLIWVATSQKPPLTTEGELMARGGTETPSLSRDIALSLYAQQQTLRALSPGSRVRPDVALTAGVGNLAAQTAYLLLFAVDARGQVHWIAPEYTQAGSDPPALSITPASPERPLPSAAVFDDLAPGRLRVVAVITRELTHVSAIEALTTEQLGAAALMKRFPHAEIRQFLLEVSAEEEP
jgi:hypothetical protein